jgi:hypothetical protein
MIDKSKWELFNYSEVKMQNYLESMKVNEKSNDERIQSGVYSGDEVADLTDICGNVEFAD